MYLYSTCNLLVSLPLRSDVKVGGFTVIIRTQVKGAEPGRYSWYQSCKVLLIAEPVRFCGPGRKW